MLKNFSNDCSYCLLMIIYTKIFQTDIIHNDLTRFTPCFYLQKNPNPLQERNSINASRRIQTTLSLPYFRKLQTVKDPY